MCGSGQRSEVLTPDRNVYNKDQTQELALEMQAVLETGLEAMSAEF